MLLALVGTAALLTSCKVVSVTGPSSGRVGDVLTYEIDLEQTNDQSFTDVSSWLSVELPTSWSVVDASFTGTVGGTAVDGTPMYPVVRPLPQNCSLIGPAPPGFQRLHFTTAPFARTDPGDRGSVTLELLVGDDLGNHTLRFELSSQEGDSFSAWCVVPAVDHQVVIAGFSVTEIPTLGSWGVGLLALLLAALACSRLPHRA